MKQLYNITSKKNGKTMCVFAYDKDHARSLFYLFPLWFPKHKPSDFKAKKAK